MANLSDLIPGLAAAQALEREWHDYAFLPLGLPIAGIDTAHLTLERAHLLMQAKSPFLFARQSAITAPAVVSFLWIVSAGWDPRCQRSERDAFYERAACLPLESVLQGIREYVRLELIDLDTTDDSGPPEFPPWSWVVGLIDQLAREYGWSPHVIMRQTSLGMIFQLCRRIAVRHGEPMPDGPLTTKAKREWLETVNARRN